jgi:hypothetical protein
MQEKQYEVEVYEKCRHGKYGKQHYFGWVLSSDKKENAISFALDILAGMTPNEVRKESDGRFYICGVCGLHTFIPTEDGGYKYASLDLDKPFGYEEVERRFSVKARLFRG